MSDGPHRSLKMRPRWKKWAKCADTDAFTQEDVTKRLAPALAQDWQEEIGSSGLASDVRAIFGDGRQTSFLPSDKTDRLEDLRHKTAGMPFAAKFLDNCIYIARQGFDGPPALHEATSLTLHERAIGGVRQVEEHYCRESNNHRAATVRSRMEAGITRNSIDGLASKMLSPSPGGSKNFRVSKQSGVDDGVQI